LGALYNYLFDGIEADEKHIGKLEIKSCNALKM
jgi:hypothetical protein